MPLRFTVQTPVPGVYWTPRRRRRGSGSAGFWALVFVLALIAWAWNWSVVAGVILLVLLLAGLVAYLVHRVTDQMRR